MLNLVQSRAERENQMTFFLEHLLPVLWSWLLFFSSFPISLRAIPFVEKPKKTSLGSGGFLGILPRGPLQAPDDFS